jgi:cyclomaltodextrinase / maltogenic alpha-amylase / neopullulanase
VNATENKYFDTVGFLYPYDVRYDADDRAFCDPLADGSVRFRIWTEPQFAEAVLVYRDDVSRGADMRCYAADSRFRYWETIILPLTSQITYSFALKTADGHIVYWCQHGVDHAVEELDRWSLDLSTAQPFETPAWMHGAVVYQIFPDRFANGDTANDPEGTRPWGSPPAWLEFQGGDLKGVTQRLDYLADLGVDVLYLTPIFASPSTHKYDTYDYYHVDPGFGGDDALRELVDGLHRRGMKIILDASFNHCHPRFFAFQDLIQNGEASRYRDWFTVKEYPVRVKHRPHMARPLSGTQPADHRRAVYAQWLQQFPVHAGIPLEVLQDEGQEVEPTYLAWYGVLDMPKINQRNPETRAYFMDVTAHWLRKFDIDGWRMDVARHIEPDFWLDFHRAAKAAKPDCYLLAEIWGNTAPWLQGDRFDATMNYIFRDLCVDYFAKATLPTGAFLDGVTRMLSLYVPQVMAATHNLFSSHDVARFRHEAGEDIRCLKLATFFQLTMPGAPGIYYGDEIGITGGPDPDCRRAFPWDAPGTWDRAMLELTRTLTHLRRKHLALKLGDWKLVQMQPDAAAVAFERSYEGERVLVIVNRGDAPATITLPVAASAAQMLYGAGSLIATRETLRVEDIPAWSGVVVRI